MDASEEPITEPVDADLSSSEDAADHGLLGAASTAAEGSEFQMGDKKMNTNFEHNKKERERRKVLKEAVTQLREQLRKPTRKPVTIKVLEAAQNEIKELKTQEESRMQRWETLKKKESHLQWKIEELKKELSRLPDSEVPELVPAAHPVSSPTDTLESCDSSTLSQQPTAACLPPSPQAAPSLPAAYIISLPQAAPTPLMNFPLAPPTIPATLFQPRLTAYPPHAAATFLQAFHLPPVAATPPPHINHQATTHFVPPHSLASAGSIRQHPLPLLPPRPFSTSNPIALGLDSSYMMPAHTFLAPQLLRPPPSLTTRRPGFIGQSPFPSINSSDHHLCLSNPIRMPLADATREETIAAPALGTINPLHLTSSINAENPLNPSLHPRDMNHRHRHAPSTSLGTPPHPATVDNTPSATEAHDTGTLTINVEEITRNPSLHAAVPKKTASSSAVEVAAIDSVEENDKRESISVSAGHSLPDDDETDVSDNYPLGRKKRRRKKRNREECQSSSDSESEGSCASSRKIRLYGERFRNSSSRSSSGSTEPSKRSKGGKANTKKCPTSGNQLQGIPPLLKVSAAELVSATEFHWSCAKDQGNGSRSMELISECEITVSANASYSPEKQQLQRPLPCPTLESLPLQSAASHSSIATSTAATMGSPGSTSSSTGEEADSGWTEAIIERSMNNLKKKFGEIQSHRVDLNGGCSNYGHPTKTARPILLT